jgi:glutaredoxin-like YruB-family protein
MVTVYSIPDCSWCQKTKAYLKSKAVDYIDINVEQDLEGRKQLQVLSKQQSVPVLDINGNIILGFDRQKIDEYLAL